MTIVSEREAEVLAALVAGLSNAQIASRLHISVRTVEAHVSSLLRKYGVADRHALARLAQPGTAAAPEPGHVAGLPVVGTSFVGRTNERAALGELLSAAGLVTLVGPGGVGKTRLATLVAESAGAAFPFGGAFVDLVPVRDDVVSQAVAAALGVAESPKQPLLAAIIDRLNRGRSLLVLDNCEHVLDAVAEFVQRVLAGCRDTTVLATSRERIGATGERVVTVDPLPVTTDAVTLLRQRAPDFDTDDDAVITELCTRLDGMPLAIELAAARSASLGADALLTALDDNLRLLSGSRQVDWRHRSVRSVIGWSHNLLDAQERALLRRLAVFAGPFDLAGAAAVDGRDTVVVADLLGRLVDKTLVIRRRGHWHLQATVRAFAAEQLETADDRAAVRTRYLDWAATTAARLADRLVGEWRDDFDAVVADLRAALAATQPTPDATAHRLASSLGRLCYARRFLQEAQAHFHAAAARAPRPADAARDLRRAADCAHVTTSSAAQAYQLLLAEAEQAQAAGDDNGVAIALSVAVSTAARFPSHFTAEVSGAQLDELLYRARAAGDARDRRVAAQLALARAWHSQSDTVGPTLPLARAAEQAARATGDPLVISASLDVLSAAVSTQGHVREAHRFSTERLALLADLPREEPASAAELIDTFQMACLHALNCGDLTASLAAARLAQDDDLVGTHPFFAISKLIPPLVLIGEFNDALAHAGAVWHSWERAGGPAAKMLAPTMSAAALACGLIGDHAGYQLWRARTARVAGVADIADAPRQRPFAAFVDARVAIHNGRIVHADSLVAKAFAECQPSNLETYALAAGAELAVLANLPNAPQLLDQAQAQAGENDWAMACLTRARGRLNGDAATLTEAAQRFRDIHARFEHASTTALIQRLHETV